MNITAQNYEASVKNIDFASAPDAIKATHSKYGTLAKYYGKNDSVTETLDIYFKQLSKWVSNVTTKASPSPTATKSDAADDKEVKFNTPNKAKKEFKKRLTEDSPAKKASKPKLSKIIKMGDGHEYKRVSREWMLKNWEKQEIYAIDLDEQTERLIQSKDDFDSYDDFGVEIEKPSKKSAPKKADVKKAAPKKASPSKKKVAVKKVVKIKTVKVKEPKAPVMRKIVSLELQVIKSYLAMDGKNVKPLTFSMLYGKIDKAIREKRIADHKTAIDEMHSKLKTIVEDIKAKNITTAIAVKFDNDFKEKLQKIVGSATERVRTSYFAGTGDKSYKEFIAEESKHAEGHTYRGKILFGQPVVLKEKNNHPVKSWQVDELKIANELSDKLNKAAKNFR